MLTVDRLVKRYKRVLAVDNLSFRIEEGHIYGFVGANGAGKTTTMKITAGLLRATSGRVLINGIDITKNPAAAKRYIGYMPDFFGVYDDLKVSEYMEFYAGLHGISPSDARKTAGQLLELVNLQDRQDFYVDSLSRGMKQRLCLARCLIHDPKLLILDEPASGLDPKARAEMKEILKELKNLGKTVLISSHILPELSEICTAIGIIDRGRMVASGTVEEIMRKASAGRTLKIRVLGDRSAAVRLLKEQPQVGEIINTSDFINAEFTGSDEDLSAILKQMVSKDIKVVSFAETERNLESVFMNIINGEGVQNAG